MRSAAGHPRVTAFSLVCKLLSQLDDPRMQLIDLRIAMTHESGTKLRKTPQARRHVDEDSALSRVIGCQSCFPNGVQQPMRSDGFQAVCLYILRGPVLDLTAARIQSSRGLIIGGVRQQSGPQVGMCSRTFPRVDLEPPHRPWLGCTFPRRNEINGHHATYALGGQVGGNLVPACNQSLPIST